RGLMPSNSLLSSSDIRGPFYYAYDVSVLRTTATARRAGGTTKPTLCAFVREAEVGLDGTVPRKAAILRRGLDSNSLHYARTVRTRAMITEAGWWQKNW